MASNLTVDTLTKGATTLNTDELVDVNNTRVCTAWVNFNINTRIVTAGFNVSSVTDMGSGRHKISFVTSMSNTLFGCLGTVAAASANMIVVTESSDVTRTASSVDIHTNYVNSTLWSAGPAAVSIAVFGGK